MSRALLSRKVIVISVIVIILVLVLIFFIRKPATGQATSAGTAFTSGQGGIMLPIDTSGISVGSALNIYIGANIGAAQSVAFDFALNYPADALTLVSVTPSVSWGADAFTRTTPSLGSILFEHGTLDYVRAFTGNRQLAIVTFRVNRLLKSPDFQELTFSRFNVYDLQTGFNVITSTIGGAGTTIVSPCTEATCRVDYGLIARNECPPEMDSATCKSRYNLVDSSLCVGTCPAVDSTLCTPWLNNLDTTGLTTALTEAQRTALCTIGATTGFNADLNGDGQVNDGDVIIIQLAMLAKESRYNTCGGSGEISCPFPGVYVCENLQNSYTAAIASCGG